MGGAEAEQKTSSSAQPRLRRRPVALLGGGLRGREIPRSPSYAEVRRHWPAAGQRRRNVQPLSDATA